MALATDQPHIIILAQDLPAGMQWQHNVPERKPGVRKLNDYIDVWLSHLNTDIRVKMRAGRPDMLYIFDVTYGAAGILIDWGVNFRFVSKKKDNNPLASKGLVPAGEDY